MSITGIPVGSRKAALVLGGGGFIGNHLVRQLKGVGFWVRAADLVHPKWAQSIADEFIITDLRDKSLCRRVFDLGSDRSFDEVYQLAADMGGAGYVFSGKNDAAILYNSASINLNVLAASVDAGAEKVFFASSACIYPRQNQIHPESPNCSEDTAYPAEPDSEYGWEKLFGERLYLSFARDYGLKVRIGRFHNIFGPEGHWIGGREKAPAALCRKVIEAPDGGEVEIWGDGLQTRSFLYVDECIEAIRLMMLSEFQGPVNIGSEERISINDLARMIIDLSKKTLSLRHIPGPQGVRGRNSDNRLIMSEIGWRPQRPLIEGIRKTYLWLEQEIRRTESRLALQ